MNFMFEKDNITPTISIQEIKEKPYYTVLSVELGNTTIKSIITTTNLKTNNNYQINKTVNLTRDIRKPKLNEEIICKTLWDQPLTKESIIEIIQKTINQSLKQSNMVINDLDFVVRSTGITATNKDSVETGIIIKTLADACLQMNIPPSKMTPSLKIENLPKHIQKYSYLTQVQFDGSVVSVMPPKTKMIVANEMEGELVTAGLKLASNWTNIDYRNPVISIDMGTTLAGRIIDDNAPYADVVGNFCGLAGAISDIIVSNRYDDTTKDISMIDIKENKSNPKINSKISLEYTKLIHENIIIEEVPQDTKNCAGINVNTKYAKKHNITLIGCNIKNKKQLQKIGKEIQDTTQLLNIIDHVNAKIIERLIEVANQKKIISPETTLGITGRAGTTGKKQEIIKKTLSKQFKEILFYPDALAMGAAMMVRCMNSLGTPTKPIGGKKHSMCIMQQRIFEQKKKLK